MIQLIKAKLYGEIQEDVGAKTEAKFLSTHAAEVELALAAFDKHI